MCYYNGVKLPKADIIKLQALEVAITEKDLFNRPLQSGFDYSNYPVIVLNEDSCLQIKSMEWGFIPHYIHDRLALEKLRKGGVNGAGKFVPPITTLNAVGEEMLAKPMFQRAARTNRCLVLSSGFYEWRHVYPLNKRTGQPLKTPNKYPYYISLKNQEIFFMAGIYNEWTDKSTGEHVNSFAIVTTKANALMEQIHNSRKRMPLILDEQLAVEWLSPGLRDDQITRLVNRPIAAELMQAWPIGKDFQTSGFPDTAAEYPELQSITSF